MSEPGSTHVTPRASPGLMVGCVKLAHSLPSKPNLILTSMLVSAVVPTATTEQWVAPEGDRLNRPASPR